MLSRIDGLFSGLICSGADGSRNKQSEYVFKSRSITLDSIFLAWIVCISRSGDDLFDRRMLLCI